MFQSKPNMIIVDYPNEFEQLHYEIQKCNMDFLLAALVCQVLKSACLSAENSS